MLLIVIARHVPLLTFSLAWCIVTSALGQSQLADGQLALAPKVFTVSLSGGLSMARLDKHDFLYGARLTRWLESPAIGVAVEYRPSRKFPLELHLGIQRFQTAAYAEAYDVGNFGDEKLPILVDPAPVTLLYSEVLAFAAVANRWELGIGAGPCWLRVSTAGLPDTIQGGYDLIDFKDNNPWTREMLYINTRSPQRPSTFGVSSSAHLRYSVSDRMKFLLSMRFSIGFRRVLSYTNNNALVFDSGLATEHVIYATHTVSYSGNGLQANVGFAYALNRNARDPKP